MDNFFDVYPPIIHIPIRKGGRQAGKKQPAGLSGGA